MGYPQRNDNITQNMMREVNLLEHDRKTQSAVPVTDKQKKLGKIAFFAVLALIVLIILLFVIL